MFICIPILFGCQTKLKQEPNQIPCICPKCHNPTFFPTKKNVWFELFFIPVIPLSRKHILFCTICGYQAPLTGDKGAPASVGANKSSSQLRTAQGWDAPNQPGYQPTYINHPQKQ